MPKKSRKNGATAIAENYPGKERNQEAIDLIDTWISDKSGYDGRVWPIVKKRIEENRLSIRKRFHD